MNDKIWDFIFAHDSLDFIWKTERFFIMKYRKVRYWYDPKERWIRSLKIGSWVEDCRGQVCIITEKDGDDVIVGDGYHCSLWACCCPPPGQEPSYWPEEWRQ